MVAAIQAAAAMVWVRWEEVHLAKVGWVTAILVMAAMGG